MPQEDSAKVKSLYKALRVLDYFLEYPFEYGVTDIAESTDLPKSTIHNIFSTFHQYGLLEYVEQGKRYRLGPKAVELGNVYHQSNSFVSILRPYLDRLAEETQERVYLGKLTADGSVLYLDMAYPKSSIMASDIIGVKAPLYCTGIGKAILAFSDDTVIDKVVHREMTKFTVNTITDPDKLLAELQQIRSCGYAVDDMEHEFGVKCVAIPLFNQRGMLLGGMSISGPSLRLPKYKIEEFAALLQGVSLDIRKLL